MTSLSITNLNAATPLYAELRENKKKLQTILEQKTNNLESSKRNAKNRATAYTRKLEAEITKINNDIIELNADMHPKSMYTREQWCSYIDVKILKQNSVKCEATTTPAPANFTLKLANRNITDNQLEGLFKAIAEKNEVIKVDLANNEITAAGIEVLKPLLSKELMENHPLFSRGELSFDGNNKMAKSGAMMLQEIFTSTLAGSTKGKISFNIAMNEEDADEVAANAAKLVAAFKAANTSRCVVM